MPSSVAAAWRALLKRLASDWLILTAALVTVALSTVLLAAGPIYADAVTLSALQQTITAAPPSEALVEIEQETPPELYEASEGVVVAGVTAALAEVGAEVLAHAESESFGLVNASDSEKTDLISFQHFEGIADRITVVSGRLPTENDTSVEAAIPSSVAELLGLNVGDSFSSENRRQPDFIVEVVVTGLYKLNSSTDTFWFEDPLALDGVVESASFRTFGPFVVTLDTLLNQLAPNRLTAGWRAFPHFDDLAVDMVPALRSDLFRLGDDLNQAYAEAVGSSAAADITVTSELPVLLGETDRSLTVTRSNVVALLLQLAILAGYALVLTAGLLVDVRRTETYLLRSRGASPSQIGGISVMEGVVLTVPVALLAPWLASIAVGLFARYGPISELGLAITPRPNLESYILSTVAALAAIVALSWPSYRSAKRFPDTASWSRQQSRSGTQRIGIDIALMALAGIAFWQLQVLGPEVGATVKGRFGVDPLLLIAPALGLLTGAILALRIVPLLALAAEKVASAGRQLISALAAWQLARRPLRYARSSLLLMIAIGIGFFASSYTITWTESQRDQAEFRVGADMAVEPNRRTGTSIDDAFLQAVHENIEGVTTSMPILSMRTQLANVGGRTNFMMFDAGKAADVVRIRDDLGADFPSLMAELEAGRPELAHIGIPDEASRIGVELGARTSLDVPPGYPGPDPDPWRLDLLVSAVVQDGGGRIHTVRLGSIPADAGPIRIEGDLFQEIGASTSAMQPPVSFIGLEIFTPIPPGRPTLATIDFHGVLSYDATTGWQPLNAAMDSGSWTLDRSNIRGLAGRPSITFSEDQFPPVISIDLNTGFALGGGSPPLYLSVRPSGTHLAGSIPIVVSESFLERELLSVGDTTALSSLGIANHLAHIVGTVVMFPTVGVDDAEVVLMDLATFEMLTYGPGVSLDPATEYWLATEGRDTTRIESTLLGPEIASASVLSVDSTTDGLMSDPVALGTIGALALGFIAAAVFAVVGFSVSATVSARDRIKEFALLRALGLAPRQLGGWLSLEQGALVVVSLALGTAVGALLTALLLPLVTLTQDGSPTTPEVIVVFPWAMVLGLEAVVVVVLAVAVVLMTLLVRRLGLGSVLRVGDD